MTVLRSNGFTLRSATGLTLGALNAASSGGGSFVAVDDAASLAQALTNLDPATPIRLSAAYQDEVANLSNYSFASPRRIEADAAARPRQFVLDNCNNFDFDGITATHGNPGNLSSPQNIGTYQLTTSTNIQVRNGEIDNTPDSGNMNNRVAGFRTDFGSSITIDNMDVHHVRDGGGFNRSTVSVTNSTFRQIYEDAITGFDSDWLVDDNRFFQFQGINGKVIEGTTTGTIVPGYYYASNGNGGRLLAWGFNSATNINANDGAIRYQGPDLPLVGDVLVKTDDPGATITITRVRSSPGDHAGNAADGIHGDVFQPLLAQGSTLATRDCQLYFRRNRGYRTLPYVPQQALETDEANAVGLESYWQLLLAQPNAAAGNANVGWGDVDISSNMSACGAPIGITLNQAWAPGSYTRLLRNNTVLTNPRSAADSAVRLRAGRTINLLIENNISDAINSPPGWIDDGNHTGLVDNGNLEADKANFGSIFNAVGEPNYADDSAFTPSVGGPAENNFGALDTAGAFRSLIYL